jgi:hypothetical protein
MGHCTAAWSTAARNYVVRPLVAVYFKATKKI